MSQSINQFYHNSQTFAILQVISLPSMPLGNVPMAGSPLSLNQNIGSDFQKAAYGAPPLGIHSGYTGKAQGLDLELQNPDQRSAMQHAGEGDHEDAIPLKDRPYNNLQSSKEQENTGFDNFAGLSGDAVLQKAISTQKVTTRVRKVPADVNDITETAYRSRSTSGQHSHAPKKLKRAKKPSYHDDDEAESYSAPKSIPRKKKTSRTKVEDHEESEEQDQGRRLFNIQFGGGGGSSSRRPTKSSGRRRPPPASHEEENEEEEEQPVQESRRSLFRVPFRVFRGVTLNRGDDGALAFNINLG